MKITKPKRTENGTYEGSIFNVENGKKKPISIRLEKALIVAKYGKENGEGDLSHYLVVKHKHGLKEVYDINEQVIHNVKENCATWFRNPLSNDLIEDYFTNNIIYDKKFGQVIKFKCMSDVEGLVSNMTVNIKITLKLIRFFKQKFDIEWDIEDAEVIEEKASFLLLDDASDNTSDEDEDPCPCSSEEVDAIRNQHIKDAMERLSILRDEQENIEKLLKQLENVNSFVAVAKICQDLDDIIFSK